ncbi:hypothetical protein [uncultured Brachyspira sp.]|uniref:hypothetical protein n=1 Tax=uncultured Brachyspira sp. TaxID=221953 RepID=UPI002614D7A3|nr:hypothetical protein [uncultured Brachyspira sp.]
MENYEELNNLIKDLDYKVLFANSLKIDELLKDDIILDDILSENLFVLSFELLDMVKSNPKHYNISDINDNEIVKALSSIIRKMELSFIEF